MGASGIEQAHCLTSHHKDLLPLSIATRMAGDQMVLTLATLWYFLSYPDVNQRGFEEDWNELG